MSIEIQISLVIFAFWLLIYVITKIVTVGFDWSVSKIALVVAQHSQDKDNELLEGTIAAASLVFLSLAVMGYFYH